MDRLRKWHCTAVALLLMLTVVATPVIAKTRITSRGIELPGDGPQTDTTGEPDDGGGSGLPRDERGMRDPVLLSRALDLKFLLDRVLGIDMELDLIVRALAFRADNAGGEK